MQLDFAAQFRAWVARCKDALGISHWEIKIHLLPVVANNPDALGATPDANLAYESAVIVIKDPRQGAHNDWKRTVLHELLHAASGGTLGTRPGSKERDDLERFVERQTRSLYRLLTAGDAPSLDAARICFRTAKTAREGGGQGMEQLIKMLMELAGDESFKALPPEALAKFQAVISAAAGLSGGEASPPSAPEGAALAVDPMADKEKSMDDKAYAMRVQALRAATERNMKAALADSEALAKNAFVARIGAELSLTPAQETKIKGMPVEQARAYVEGIKESGAAFRVNSASLRLGPADAPRGEQAEPSLAISELGETDESIKKMSPALLDMRRQMARENPSGWKLAVMRAGGN